MKQMTAKQLRNEVVNRLWSYGDLPKNIQTFIGDEVAFMMEIIKTKTNEALASTSVVREGEQLVCSCGKQVEGAYDPCCSLTCWCEMFEGA